jgi:thiol-disulfide isomerase/thioredoxin
MIKKISKNINKTLKKMLKPKGKITIRDLATIILSVIVLSLGVNVIMTAFKLLKKWLLPRIDIEGFEGKKEFVLLHMDGCPHCVRMIPEWNAASSENTTSINMKSLERKDDTAKELVSKNNISSFPTMLLLGGGKVLKKYDGGRTKQDFLDFLEKHD